MHRNRNCKPVRRPYLSLLLIILTVCLMLPVTAEIAEAAETGFRVENGTTYYYNNGVKHTGWLILGENKYFFNSDGSMATGWVTDSNGQKRYFSRGSGAMLTGWVKSSNGTYRYFYRNSGIMATGWTINAQGQRRYFSSGSGTMLTGWVENTNGFERYFNPKNGILYTGLHRLGQNYYYFDPSTGLRYQDGFLELDGKKYYFSKDTGAMQTGWITEGDKKYYAIRNGVIACNTTLMIEGSKQTFDANGALIEETPKPNFNFPYEIKGNNVMIQDPNGKTYPLVHEYLEHPGIADGTTSDLELLAAVCECEAGNQGLVGMEAVALCILNRTIADTKEFPSFVRGVIYHGGSFPQYSTVRNNTLIKRLNGQWDNKEAALEAAGKAIALFNAHVKEGKDRTLEGFPKKDFNYMYFMTEEAFYRQPLDFSRVENFLYVSPIEDSHMFFVDWVSPYW